MTGFLVTLYNAKFRETKTTICNSKGDLATLISNLNNYINIKDIKALDNHVIDFKNLCEKNPGLETGQ